MTDDSTSADWFIRRSGWTGTEPWIELIDDDRTTRRLRPQGRFAWHVHGRRVQREVHPCVFEPKCRAADVACSCDFGAEPHITYLAFFGDRPKVGMTVATRAETRWREQGADAAMAVATVPDRGAARQVEQQISTLHRVPEFQAGRSVLPRLARPMDRPTIEQAAADWRDRLDLDPLDAPLHWIDHGQLGLPLASRPHVAAASGDHAGTWMGAHGNFWFYTPRSQGLLGPDIIAVKRQDLEGRRVRIDPVAQ